MIRGKSLKKIQIACTDVVTYNMKKNDSYSQEIKVVQMWAPQAHGVLFFGTWQISSA